MEKNHKADKIVNLYKLYVFPVGSYGSIWKFPRGTISQSEIGVNGTICMTQKIEKSQILKLKKLNNSTLHNIEILWLG